MKHKLLGVVLPLAVALVASSADASRNYSTSGVACSAAIPIQSQLLCLERNQYGIQNHCASPVTVECPINPSFNSAGQPVVSAFGFSGYDRSASSDVNCDLQRIDANATITYTANLTTTGSGAAVQGPLIAPNTIVQGVWRLRCALPAISGTNFSHLVSYGMVTNETLF